MTVSYKTILVKATNIKNNVEKKYKLGEPSKWSYYFAKAILNQSKKDVKVISFDTAKKPSGDHISNQIQKKDYLDACERLTKYVEKHHSLPNYIKWNSKHIRVRDYTYLFARILYFYDTKQRLPNYANINTKCWNKPTETGDTVYDYFCKKTGVKPKTLDDFLEYIRAHYSYEYYYDDKKSNKQVINSKAGNCTDLLQLCWNIAKTLGYDCKCIHTQCRQSGAGHVYGKFKHPKNTNGKWITRDIASIANGGGLHSVWCNVDTGAGYLLAENPSWFMQNINR